MLITKILISIFPHTIDFIDCALPPPPFSSGNHQHVVCLYEFAFVLNIYSTYKSNHNDIYLSPSDISLSIMPSRSVHVVTNGRISLFLLLFFQWLVDIDIKVVTSPRKNRLKCTSGLTTAQSRERVPPSFSHTSML